MSPHTIKALAKLDQLIQACARCSLHEGGRAKPYWTLESKYLIIGEAPGRDEVKANSPFVGPAGSALWNQLAPHGLSRKDFAIVNSVNCRPIVLRKNGKPTDEQIRACFHWVGKYILLIQPKKILLLGSYAHKSLFGKDIQVIKNNGKVYVDKYGTPVIQSVHPAYTIYNEEQGIRLLTEAIEAFLRKESL